MTVKVFLRTKKLLVLSSCRQIVIASRLVIEYRRIGGLFHLQHYHCPLHTIFRKTTKHRKENDRDISLSL